MDHFSKGWMLSSPLWHWIGQQTVNSPARFLQGTNELLMNRWDVFAIELIPCSRLTCFLFLKQNDWLVISSFIFWSTVTFEWSLWIHTLTHLNIFTHFWLAASHHHDLVISVESPPLWHFLHKKIILYATDVVFVAWLLHCVAFTCVVAVVVVCGNWKSMWRPQTWCVCLSTRLEGEKEENAKQTQVSMRL